MKSKILHYAKEILIFFIIMTVFANLLSLYKSSELNKSTLDLPLLKTINNTFFELDREKPVLVHFWATWCPTCKLEAANINTISTSYQVVTIAVKSGSDQEIKNYLNENNLHFITINDYNSQLAQKFNIGAYPTTFIYDKKQDLVFSEVGYTSTWGLWLRMWWASF